MKSEFLWVDMTSIVFYSGNLWAPQKVKNRKYMSTIVLRLMSINTYEAVAPENTLLYIGVKDSAGA
jgi:hypothetical protein